MTTRGSVQQVAARTGEIGRDRESEVNDTRILVVGPGWLGHAVASALAADGARVWTLRRGAGAETTTARDVIALRGDIRLADAAEWGAQLPDRLDHVVVCIAPSRLAGDTHQATYPASVHGALELASARHARSLVYTSSTGVYARTDGGISRETDVISRRDERQGALLEAEAVLRDWSQAPTVGRTILRVAGLYGPGRDPAARFRGTVPTDASDVWCNFSWRDDVVRAVQCVLGSPASPGTTRVLNCADGTPMLASTIAKALGAVPGPASSVSTSAGTGARSNQQIFIDGLRALGWSPATRTVFDGLEALGHHLNRPVS